LVRGLQVFFNHNATGEHLRPHWFVFLFTQRKKRAKRKNPNQQRNKKMKRRFRSILRIITGTSASRIIVGSFRGLCFLETVPKGFLIPSHVNKSFNV
jgi:hypothetical protein